MLIGIAVLEFHPAVKQAQSYVSLENYEDQDVDCRILLNERPWYGKINHWFFTWLILIPTLIFAIALNAATWLRSGRILFAIAMCYGLMNLAVHLQWDIRNAPFSKDPFNPNPLNGWRMDCANYAGDGFSYILALWLAWIPASLYTGFCLFLWSQYHRKWSKKITDGFKHDIINTIFSIGLRTYSVVALLYITFIIIYAATDIVLPFHPDLIKIAWIIIVRPLFIPIEIFFY